jgi:YD repeat-containing protein
MNRKSAYLFGAAASAFVFHGAAQASDTTVYTYDALGRLVSVSTTGGPNNGLNIGTAYDPAGNRTTYTAGTGGAPPPPPPPPPPSPPPPPPNQPPVANPNSLSAVKCSTRSVDVIANDTDPEGHYPLALTGVNQPWAWVESGTNVGMQTPETNGTYVITYTVADSLGATANGSLTVTVSGTQQCV